MAAMGLRHLYEENKIVHEPPSTCDSIESWEETGKKLFESIKMQVIYDGETGKVAFDAQGDRIFAEYTLMNVKENKKAQFGSNDLQTVGEYSYDMDTDEMQLFINLSEITWPGKRKEVPQGYILPTHFRVMTLHERPFVYAEPIASPEDCGPTNEALCPLFNTSTNETQLMCCWGYCIDLLFTLAKKNNFTFSLELSPSVHYGALKQNSQGKKEWTGIIGQLVNEENGIDMVAAPLTINPERSDAIAFSKPFKYQGITILVKRVPHEPALVSILQPFRDTLWLMLLATVHVIALVVWILDRLSPVYK
ncbi:Glutamate receptor ionotropic, NMDA 1 [Halocaridina rubra]|uniref:Glutamate receptor ionotropic, NMDA 1 n=1 Tax=Halocaridina rubra TaxID=373956 RepID=A0AAN9AF42_HALRR